MLFRSWHLGQQDLTLSQQFQMLTGTLGSTPISDARMRGNQITFTAGGAQYTGEVKGTTMQGTTKGGSGGSWSATKK